MAQCIFARALRRRAEFFRLPGFLPIVRTEGVCDGCSAEYSETESRAVKENGWARVQVVAPERPRAFMKVSNKGHLEQLG